MRIGWVLLILVLLAAVRLCVFTVDRTEFVYVTRLGQHVATYDGADDDQAGLHFRWPWPAQSLTRVDRRLQVLDLPAAELVTEDPGEAGTIDKTLEVDAYLVWKVPDAEAAGRFILAFESVDHARRTLRDRYRSRLAAVIARRKFDDLISADAGAVDRERERLRAELLQGGTAEDGIAVVDVRVRRLNYPPQVRHAIFERIRSERERQAARYVSRGTTAAAKIRNTAETDAKTRKAEAEARNDRKRGQADARADGILNEAISKDPDYYAELERRRLAELGLDSKKRIYSTTLFKLLFPSVPAPGAMKKPEK